MGLKSRTMRQMEGGEKGRWVYQAVLGSYRWFGSRGGMCQSGRSFHSLK